MQEMFVIKRLSKNIDLLLNDEGSQFLGERKCINNVMRTKILITMYNK